MPSGCWPWCSASAAAAAAVRWLTGWSSTSSAPPYMGFSNECSEWQDCGEGCDDVPSGGWRGCQRRLHRASHKHNKKIKGSPYSITERRVPELIPVLGSQPTVDVSHKPDGRLPLLSARPAVIRATLKRAATNFAAWWTQARWVWTVCLRLLPDSVAAAIWTLALLRLSPAR